MWRLREPSGLIISQLLLRSMTSTVLYSTLMSASWLGVMTSSVLFLSVICALAWCVVLLLSTSSPNGNISTFNSNEPCQSWQPSFERELKSVFRIKVSKLLWLLELSIYLCNV